MPYNVDENELLNDILRGGDQTANHAQVERPSDPMPAQVTAVQNLDLCQWQVCPNGMFRPAAKTVSGLKAGAFVTGADEFGPYLKEQRLMSDDIVELPDSANARVLEGIQKFWTVRGRYSRHGLVFKRGCLLWGPPGSGKTITVHLLARDLIMKGGMVLFCDNPKLMIALLTAVRRIESDRPLIVVLEDIDEIISAHGEHAILSMLDGENQTDNVCYLATTNYPERLGARIVNRPSRFDERVYVGMPSLAARRAYLGKVATGVDVERWAAETDGLSIAHLRELIAAVLCLDQEFGDVIKRLRSMNERPKDVDGFKSKSAGFLSQGKPGNGLLR